MKFFDLHCDTIKKIHGNDKKFASAKDVHVNLPGIISSNTIAQVFACFVMGVDNPDKEFEECNTYIDSIKVLTKKYSDRLILATSCENLAKAVETKEKTAVIIAIEGANPLKGNPENLEHFYNRGVRLLTIAWNDNEFCGTVFGNNGGLTKSGEKLIQYCNELGVIVDVSHASDKAFYDIASISKKSVVASHSNAREVCPNNRNLSDDMIKIIAQKGGIIGLTYGSGFIEPEYFRHEKKVRQKILKGFKDKSLNAEGAKKIYQKALSHLKDASLAMLVKHAKHILNKGGENCLGLGSDFDGVDSLPQSIEGVQSLGVLVAEMRNQGISSRIIDKITYKNSYQYFKDFL